MAQTLFQGKGGKVPFPRTEAELINNAMIADLPYEQAVAQAKHKIRQDVFGHDFQVDAKGEPIERGKGSASQPTSQHQEALMISEEAKAKRAMTMGWHPGLATAFDPRAQAIIDEMQAKIERMARKAPARKKTKKAKPAAKAPPSATAEA